MRDLFGTVHIASAVHQEVVVAGAGRAASSVVGGAGWIQVHPSFDEAAELELSSRHSLGRGETATLLLAEHLKADVTIVDERKARRLAKERDLRVTVCVGLLEAGARRGFVNDLRDAYRLLNAEGARIDRRILNQSLASFGLPSLQPL